MPRLELRDDMIGQLLVVRAVFFLEPHTDL